MKPGTCAFLRSVLPDRPNPSPRFHGRIPGQRPCAVPGCDQHGEFRAPGERRPGFDGPGSYRWMCLDHVREFNAGYNFFAGMTPEEIVEAQGPYGGWERETRAFSATGADAPPKWSDFRDPMDALGARFRKVREQARDAAAGISREDREAYDALGLSPGADLKTVRQAYSNLVRRYHPDRNGGDRRYEKALQAVIAAYGHLKAKV
ncbi:DnaJ domain-containing protein [Sphingomonas lacunae]|uniref:DnaJ domain-containing protein n=1 Tax=Sphingomonas lacunae TaxID=2698828 RepID=A0A6M4AQH6_9SPHN|nr:DnaJ domain-containing protein [Sphingomonas lacunae]